MFRMIRPNVDSTVLLDILPDKVPLYLILPVFNFSIIEQADSIQLITPKIISKFFLNILKEHTIIKAMCLAITDCPVMDTAVGCGGLGYYHFRFSMQQVKISIKKDCIVFSGPKHLVQRKFFRPNR